MTMAIKKSDVDDDYDDDDDDGNYKENQRER